MKFSQEEINNIVGLKGADGKLIDIFKLHGVLFIGNTVHGAMWLKKALKEGVMWDLEKTYTMFSEHTLGVTLEEFDWCETEENVHEQFNESLKKAVIEQLL